MYEYYYIGDAKDTKILIFSFLLVRMVNHEWGNITFIYIDLSLILFLLYINYNKTIQLVKFSL